MLFGDQTVTVSEDVDLSEEADSEEGFALAQRIRSIDKGLNLGMMALAWLMLIPMLQRQRVLSFSYLIMAAYLIALSLFKGLNGGAAFSDWAIPAHATRWLPCVALTLWFYLKPHKENQPYTIVRWLLIIAASTTFAKMTEEHSFWHTIQLTEDVNLVTLDTNYSAKGPQEQWLEKQLVALRPRSKWLITNYHRPLFPAVKSVSSQAAVFVPLFEKYNVDLSLESDGHCIKRTVPIRNGKKDPTGVVCLGEGGLGVGQYKPKVDRWYLQDGGYVSRGHHVMQLDFSAKGMSIETILLNGKVVDPYVMKPRSK